MQKQILFVFVALFAVVSSQSYLAINLFATDLNGCDDLSACDAFVKIYCSSITSDWRQCGTTSKLQDDNYPIWPEIFNFTHVHGNNERWRFDVFDEDLLFDDAIGSVTVNVDDFANAVSNMHRVALGTRGYFNAHRRRQT